jgi:D-xylulose reductase
MLNWKGSFRYGAGVYKLALGLVAQGKIELKPLITHRYKFDQAKEAFQCMVDNKGYDGKPPIKCEYLMPSRNLQNRHPKR